MRDGGIQEEDTGERVDGGSVQTRAAHEGVGEAGAAMMAQVLIRALRLSRTELRGGAHEGRLQ